MRSGSGPVWDEVAATAQIKSKSHREAADAVANAANADGSDGGAGGGSARQTRSANRQGQQDGGPNNSNRSSSSSSSGSSGSSGNNNNNNNNNNGSAEARGEAVHVLDCIARLLQEERLSAQNEWFCRACGAHRRAYKKLDLWALPEVLVLHLKRFRVAWSGGVGGDPARGGQAYAQPSRSKITTLVRFPTDAPLDLGPLLHARGGGGDATFGGGSSAAAAGAAEGEAADVGGGAGAAGAPGAPTRGARSPPLYQLFGVVNHMGGMGGGHYTAFARNEIDAQWYHFDDSRVVRVRDTAAIVSPNAYVLFFRRLPTARPPE